VNRMIFAAHEERKSIMFKDKRLLSNYIIFVIYISRIGIHIFILKKYLHSKICRQNLNIILIDIIKK